MRTRLLVRQLAWQCSSCRTQPTQSLALPFRPFSSAIRRRAETTQEGEPIHAAPPIDFEATDKAAEQAKAEETDDRLRFARVVPASPSYFTGKPQFVDASLELKDLYRKYEHLPTVTALAAPRASWKKLEDFRNTVGEPVKAAKYRTIVSLLRRLNRIHPALVPPEVEEVLAKHRREVDSNAGTVKLQTVDEFGFAKAVGRRKSSSAKVHLVEGDGQVLINGRNINLVFGRVHDRESALWALKVTDRLDKYNVWALAHGGGTTGQAEAITLGVAKALIVHEPALKPILRRAGCITRDPRKVERKKPGRLKARKKPAWVKR